MYCLVAHNVINQIKSSFNKKKTIIMSYSVNIHVVMQDKKQKKKECFYCV